MLEQIQQYVTENLNTVLIAVGLLVAVVAAVLYFRNRGNSQNVADMPSHDFEGMESMNTVCDLASGVCHPQENMENMEQMQQMQQQMQQELVAEGFGPEHTPESGQQTEM